VPNKSLKLILMWGAHKLLIHMMLHATEMSLQ